MSIIQTEYKKEQLLSGLDCARLIYPEIRGAKRYNNPDNSSTDYYWPNLSGTDLIIDISGDVTTQITITFSSNKVTDVISDIAATTDLEAYIQGGCLIIKNVHGGGKNLIKITDGDACSILGLSIFPLPGSISTAGDIKSAPANDTQLVGSSSKLISKYEGLSDQSLNRALFTALSSFETVLNDLDREVCIPRTYGVTITNGAFSISSQDKVYIGFTTSPNPSTDILDTYFNFQDSNDDDVYVGPTKVRISNLTYGAYVDGSQSFVSWLTQDGKSIFGDSNHWKKTKISTNITSIKDNIVTCSGATFITKKIQVGDTVYISSATNNSPFNHNGEYIVSEIYSETEIGLRSKSLKDTQFFSSGVPNTLNHNKFVGESYGTLEVIIGKAISLTPPNASVIFKTNVNPPNGNYRVTIPTIRTLRSLSADDLITLIYRSFGGQLELGSKFLGSTAAALKPRLFLSTRDNTDFTTLIETNPIGGSQSRLRLLTSPTNGTYLTLNASWDATNWVRDVQNNNSYCIYMVDNNFKMASKAGGTPTFSSWDDILNAPLRTDSSGVIVSNGVSLGNSITGNDTVAQLPRITVAARSTGTTLISQVIRGNVTYREYIADEGLFTTYNAQWDGTKWLKDVQADYAYKINYKARKTYVQKATTANFLDSAWLGQDNYRNFIIKENFMTRTKDGTLNTAGDPVGTFFSCSTMDNSKCSIGATNGGVICQNINAVASFHGNVLGTDLRIDTKDFYLKIEAYFSHSTEGNLSSVIDSKVNRGYFIGLSSFNNLKQLGIVATGGVASTCEFLYTSAIGFHYINTQSSLFDNSTTLPTFESNFDSSQLESDEFIGGIYELERINGTLNMYYNGVLRSSISNTFDYTGMYPIIKWKTGNSGANDTGLKCMVVNRYYLSVDRLGD